MLLVTTDKVEGREIKEVIGLVKGTSVKSKSVAKDIGSGFKNLIGGDLNSYARLQEESRKAAIERMLEDAKLKNEEINAIVGLRFVSSTIAQGASEITVYGTAVILED